MAEEKKGNGAGKHIPKLHEVLAVQADLEGTAKKVSQEAITTFTKRADHFQGHHKSLEMFAEERSQEEKGAEDHKAIVTTVDKKLEYIWKAVGKHFDAILQKERTNQDARADLIVDGVVIMEGLPATFLLAMETKLKDLRAVYEAAPTLAPGIDWEDDPAAEMSGVFRMKHPETKHKQEKTIKHKVLVDPTEHHPAQIEKWTENLNVGTFITQRQCSMITPAKKSEYLGRIDKLIRACKRARQRANNTEIVKMKVASKIREFIHAPV